MMNMLFQDKLDTDRIVVPIGHKNNGRTMVCRVYFRDTGFAGKSEIPFSLFETPDFPNPVGFRMLDA